MLPPNLAADPLLLERFRLEADVPPRLQSPHIVQVYYIGEHDDNHFYAMEYVEGVDLAIIIGVAMLMAPTRYREVINYMLQASKGLPRPAVLAWSTVTSNQWHDGHQG